MLSYLGRMMLKQGHSLVMIQTKLFSNAHLSGEKKIIN